MFKSLSHHSVFLFGWGGGPWFSILTVLHFLFFNELLYRYTCLNALFFFISLAIFINAYYYLLVKGRIIWLLKQIGNDIVPWFFTDGQIFTSKYCAFLVILTVTVFFCWGLYLFPGIHRWKKRKLFPGILQVTSYIFLNWIWRLYVVIFSIRWCCFHLILLMQEILCLKVNFLSFLWNFMPSE